MQTFIEGGLSICEMDMFLISVSEFFLFIFTYYGSSVESVFWEEGQPYLSSLFFVFRNLTLENFHSGY